MNIAAAPASPAKTLCYFKILCLKTLSSIAHLHRKNTVNCQNSPFVGILYVKYLCINSYVYHVAKRTETTSVATEPLKLQAPR